MTSIQQSMNQMLGALAGATTAGTYMYRHSDTHKIKTLEKRQSKLEDASNELGVMATDELAKQLGKDPLNLTKKDLEGFYGTQSGRASEEVNKELADVSRELLQLQPTSARAEDYSRHKGNFIEQEKDMAKMKERAESDAISRLETRSMTAREMLTALQERKDLLSAKERGQLGTMAGRHKDKGGMDE